MTVQHRHAVATREINDVDITIGADRGGKGLGRVKTELKVRL